MKESDILKAILDYLAAEHIFAIRLNSGMQFGNHNGKKWVIRMAAPGTADILALPVVNECSICGQLIVPLWIEVKNEKSVQSELQKSFQKQVESHGHRYVIARSIEDVEKALEN